MIIPVQTGWNNSCSERRYIMRIGTTEIILIIILALVVFGGGKLAGIGKALGKSVRDFRNEVRNDNEDQPDDQSKA